MKLEEKMAYFKDQVTQQSQAEIDQQINQYRQTLEDDYQKFQEQTDETYAHRLVNEKEALRKENNKAISQFQINQQRELFLTEENMKLTLFQTFTKQIESYQKSEAYIEQLKKMLKNIQAYAGREKYDLYIDENDSHLRSQLESYASHPIIISDRPFMGGIRAVLRERQILVDYSFLTFLDRLKENFVIKEAD
ncbi:V-type ATP synthase subunit E [Aerococcus urinae]